MAASEAPSAVGLDAAAPKVSLFFLSAVCDRSSSKEVSMSQVLFQTLEALKGRPGALTPLLDLFPREVQEYLLAEERRGAVVLDAVEVAASLRETSLRAEAIADLARAMGVAR